MKKEKQTIDDVIKESDKKDFIWFFGGIIIILLISYAVDLFCKNPLFF